MKNMKIYDADHDAIKAFRGTGLELVVVALLNGYLQAMSANEDQAMNWIKENVQAFLPDTLIRGICAGNEVLGVAEFELWGALLGAVKNKSTRQLFFFRSCTFKKTVKQKYMKPFLELFSEIGSLFCLNASPFLVYMADPANIDINYAPLEDGNETAATVNNARIYNYNLPKTYVFAVFNEDLKPGPTSGRNYGLFKVDGTICI
ncbi:hypothetical protein PRUPE_7G245500 [Prunus persica]|uniref:glucan endo-1,3-beta-D-glucosidase n=1 Tax=Prunus persica TaxID=3760 RepID=M5WF42_PRUPE|nr:hypothetical protein PRUPE_7G245500 [Prunus persica]